LKVLLVSLVAMVAFAATPVGTITTTSDFQLRGVFVHSAGVPSWPVTAGDSVTMGSAPATIHFKDGSMVNLAPYAQVKIEERNDDLNVRLVSGLMTFTTAPGSLLHFFSGSTALTATPNVATTASVSSQAASSGAATNLTKTPAAPPLSRH